MARTKGGRVTSASQNKDDPAKKKRATIITRLVKSKNASFKRLETLPPSDSSLRESLKFGTKDLRDKYKKVVDRKIIQGRSLDLRTLETLGIRQEVEELISRIGWKKLFEIDCPIFSELTREFYTTFEFDISEDLTLDTPNVIRYRLMGKEFSQSITGFNLALGVISENDVHDDWYINSRTGFGNFVGVGVWKEMSVDAFRYNPSQSSSTLLKKPEWQYLQRFLSYNLIGRKSGSVTCSKIELYCIWAMVNNVKLNLGFWLADQIGKVMGKTNKGLILGSVITQLAVNNGVLDLAHHSLHKEHDTIPLDLDTLYRMGIIEKKGEDYIFYPPHRPLVDKVLRNNLKRAHLEEPELAEESRSKSCQTLTLCEVMQKLEEISQNQDKLQTYFTQKVDEISRAQVKLQSDLKAFFDFQNFHPPSTS